MTTRPLTIGSLFSGIGGLELGLEAGLMSAGYPAHTIWQVEQSDYCRAVLARHWPHSQRFDDVTTLDTSSVPTPDIVCGGFPCQDISSAGKGAGIHGARSGLFYEMARIVRQLRPRVWVMENVPAITHRGLSDVLAEVASLGYAARWGGLRASEVGAPHRRERWFCVCWLADHDRQRGDPSAWLATGERADLSDPDWRDRRYSSMADTHSGSGELWQGMQGGQPIRRATAGRDGETMAHSMLDGLQREQQTGPETRPADRENRAPQPRSAESAVGRDADGISGWLDRHRWPAPPGPHQHPYEPPRTRPRQPNDKERLRALGNAVVPQQAAVVGRWIGEQLLH